MLWMIVYGFPNHTDTEIKNMSGCTVSFIYELKLAWFVMARYLFTLPNLKKLGG